MDKINLVVGREISLNDFVFNNEWIVGNCIFLKKNMKINGNC